ncbi:MAG: tyrosine--tRNA ligase [Rhodospirillales bacterium]|jgi:tyrosyl-tRNA synthetase|nr:tyrosine--tRNA ligase [Rhodospirillales bacterium]MBT5075783.1 tyrosine--tRNA ligase [Rhodospirillales bacterium]MBT5114386.1 tyrosine--tRNA ligase [Rhodospirillales bacterium]MBT5672778.1 tyrosine--tRNA ligase [Rhodospirillales bacterium]MBT6187003.1 tyrosine--tRNA ligase [Rhodospirillales bacterium]
MASHRSEFLNTITERGFLHQCTDMDALDACMAKGPISAYIGFDCTANSLHVGSLVPIMLLRHLQKSGHRPIVLMGGGTTKVGDPSGKDESRQLLSTQDIAGNMASIQTIFDRFLSFGDDKTDAIMVNNADWLDQLNYIDFLRDFGRHFSVNRMLGFESVKLRLEREQTLSFLEFNYMILQAYDFMELARNQDCVLQMGGSDQWGNIVNGVELTRRVDERTVYGLTSPLITTASGEKMGKTAKGAIWLSQDRLSSYDYWQFWRNTQDADVGRFLKLFTELPMDEISRLEVLEGAELNEAKKILADATTTLAHGKAAAIEAAKIAKETFEKGGAAQGLPTVEIAKAELAAGIGVIDLFKRAGLATSNSDVRRLIKGGGARANNEPISSDTVSLNLDHAIEDGAIKLSAGRKRHVLIRPV